ncbi:MAG: HesB/IscA family protein [Dongiaceae bacterium]
MDTGTHAPEAAPAAALTEAKPKRAPRARPAAIKLTPAAIERVKALLDKRGKPSAGIRIGVKTKGCSGLSYTLEFADEKGAMDEAVQQDGVTVLIDPKATLFVLGTEMDYVEEKLQSGFVFRNPNEKGRCGCGESFHV